VTSLNLGQNNIGDEGVKALAECLKTNKTVTSLDLEWNKIKDEGVKILAECLKTNKTVTILNLRYNQIGDEGVKALAECLKTNKTVTSLNLESNEIKYEGAKAFGEILAYVKFYQNRIINIECGNLNSILTEAKENKLKELRKKQEVLGKQKQVESGLMTVSEASFHNTEEFQDFLQASNPENIQEMNDVLKNLKYSQAKYKNALNGVKGGFDEILKHSGLTMEQMKVVNAERDYLNKEGNVLLGVYYSEMQKQLNALFQASVLVETNQMKLAVGKVCKVASAVSGLLSNVPGGFIIGAISDLGIATNQYVKVQKLVKLSKVAPDINSNIFITEEISRKSTVLREVEIKKMEGKGSKKGANLIKLAKEDVNRMMKYILNMDENDKIFKDKNHFIQVALNVLIGKEFVYVSPIESGVEEPQPDYLTTSKSVVVNAASADEVENLKGQFAELKQQTDDAKEEKKRLEKLEKMMSQMMEENERLKKEAEKQKAESEKLKEQMEKMKSSQGGRYSVSTQSSTHKGLLTNVIGGDCSVEEPTSMSGDATLHKIVMQHSEDIANLGVKVQNSGECQDLHDKRLDRLETPRPKHSKLRG
jgi:hypothetical protein